MSFAPLCCFKDADPVCTQAPVERLMQLSTSSPRMAELQKRRRRRRRKSKRSNRNYTNKRFGKTNPDATGSNVAEFPQFLQYDSAFKWINAMKSRDFLGGYDHANYLGSRNLETSWTFSEDMPLNRNDMK